MSTKEHVDFVLDIETLGTKPGAVILEIGAWCGGAGLTLKIDPDSHCGKVELDTLQWWANVPDMAARHNAFTTSVKRYELKDALLRLNEFIAQHNPNYFWGCSPDFDYKHLEHWCNLYDIEIPWKYHQLRDVRTIRDLLTEEKLETLKKRACCIGESLHMAGADARYEWLIVREVRRQFDILKGVAK